MNGLRRRVSGDGELGQAMTEFSLIAAALLVGVGGLAMFLPDMLNAFQIYLDSHYYVLSMPIP